MSTCKSCKHWNREEGFKFGECQRIKHDFRADTDEPESCLDEPAYTIDGSGYMAELRTQADFGCTLWEEKK